MKSWLLRMVVAAAVSTPVFVSADPAKPSAPATEVTTLSASQAEKVLQGKHIYRYVIVSSGEAIDVDGRHFSPRTAGDYLKRAKPKKKGVFVLLIKPGDPADIIRDFVPAFAAYGATEIVVQHLETEGETIASPGTGGSSGKKLVMFGVPNPKSLTALDPLPDLLGRPAPLRPGKLPARVRYQFKPDAEVMAAAAALQVALLGDEPPAASDRFGESLIVLPGAWKRLSHRAELQAAKPMYNRVELGRKVAQLEGRYLSEAAMATIVRDDLRAQLKADGGGVIRALASDEMDFWWTFIGFDIEEPVFVVASKGGARRYVVGFGKDGVNVVDELNGLPTPR